MKPKSIIFGEEYTSSTNDKRFDVKVVSDVAGLNIPKPTLKRKNVGRKIASILKKSKEKYAAMLSNECEIPLRQSQIKVEECINFSRKAQDVYSRKENYWKIRSINLIPKGRVLLSASGTDPLEGVMNALVPALYTGNQVVVKPSRRKPKTVYKLISDILEKIPPLKNDLHLLFTKNKTLEKLIKQKIFDMVYWTGGEKSTKLIRSYCAYSNTEFLWDGPGADLLYLDSSWTNLTAIKKMIDKTLQDLNGTNCNRIQYILFQENPNIRKLFEKYEEIHIKKTKPNKVMELEPKEIHAFTVKNLDEAIAFQNSSPYGLGFTVYGNYTRKTFTKKTVLASRININKDPLDVSYFDPWGGIKLSGSNGVEDWILKFSSMQKVVSNEE